LNSLVIWSSYDKIFVEAQMVYCYSSGFGFCFSNVNVMDEFFPSGYIQFGKCRMQQADIGKIADNRFFGMDVKEVH